MSVSKTVFAENRDTAGLMRESKPRHSLLAYGEMGHVTSHALLAIVAVLVAGGGAVVGVLASASRQPLLLTLTSVLAMFGVFFLFAFAAGHVRITERVTSTDLSGSVAGGLMQAVMVSGRNGEPLYYNSAWEALVGRGVSGGLRSFDQLVVGETAASEALFRLTRAASEQIRQSEEMRLPSAGDERPRWLDVSVSPLPMPVGHGVNGPLTLWVASDITLERTRQAIEAANLKSRLEDFEAMPVGLLTFSGEGVVGRMNGMLAGWLGIVADPGRMLRLSDLMSEDAGHLLQVLAGEKPAAGAPARAEIELIREDGKRLPVTVLAAPRRAAEEAYVVAVLPRPAEAAAPAAGESKGGEARFVRLYQSAPFGIATISADGRIVGANAAFSRMLLEPASLDGRLVSDIVCRALEGEQRTAAMLSIEKAVSGQAVVPPIEVPVGPKGEFTRRCYMSALSASVGSREAAVLFLIDVSEQKALEVKFAQSQKMEAVGKLAGGIAHDFNNVLTAIIGFSDLLLQTHRPTDAAYRDIMNIKSSANRAAGMVRQLLAFSRRQTLQTEVLQLGELITELLPLLNRAVGEKITIKPLPARDLWYVRADKTQFEQVMINLAVNAGDAMPDGGRLTIRTRNVSERESAKVGGGMVPGEYVLVEVEDTGVGMTAELMSKIFEPFFTTKGVGKGTGLGLATVYGIVKQTGGYIYPESTPGKGTTFRVYLPRHHGEQEEETAAQKEKKKERPTADLTGTGRVLLVEDEDYVRNYAVRALKGRGYEVFEASTGLEALEVLDQKCGGSVDLVVSDVVMPEMDGPTLLREIRKAKPDMKFILMSGYPDDAFKRNLDENETFAFLQKPFSLPQLAQKVKEQLVP
jgi:two-component system cell cycle sensor histidine kinase/response regulator CckA